LKILRFSFQLSLSTRQIFFRHFDIFFRDFPLTLFRVVFCGALAFPFSSTGDQGMAHGLFPAAKRAPNIGTNTRWKKNIGKRKKN